MVEWQSPHLLLCPALPLPFGTVGMPAGLTQRWRRCLWGPPPMAWSADGCNKLTSQAARPQRRRRLETGRPLSTAASKAAALGLNTDAGTANATSTSGGTAGAADARLDSGIWTSWPLPPQK